MQTLSFTKPGSSGNVVADAPATGSTSVKVANLVLPTPGMVLLTITPSVEALTGLKFTRAARVGGTHVAIKTDAECDTEDDLFVQVIGSTLYQTTSGTSVQILVNWEVGQELGIWAKGAAGTVVLTVDADYEYPTNQRSQINQANASNATFAGTLTVTGASTLTGAVAFGGGLTASGAVANTFAGSTGTFVTSTGANTLSGTTTVAANKNLLCASGTTGFDFSAGSGAFLTSTGAVTIGGRCTFSKSLLRPCQSSLTALSSASAAITADKDIVLLLSVTTATTYGWTLPTGVAGMVLQLVNTAAYANTLIPASGGTINGLSANAGVTIAASKCYIAICSAADTWHVMEAAKATAA
jgi:hypothetical protein